MTISGVSAVYTFPRIARSENRPTPAASPDRAESAEPKQLDLFTTEPVVTTPLPENTDSIDRLLDDYFAEKVKRHDIDRDGSLSPEEFCGPEEVFAVLDSDEDGLVSAEDLKRHFLQENAQLESMVSGYASTVYDRLLNESAAGDEELQGIVEETLAGLFDQQDENNDEWLSIDEFPGTSNEFRRLAGEKKYGIRTDDLIQDFQEQHPDLVTLRDTLHELKNTITPRPPPAAHVDITS